VVLTPDSVTVLVPEAFRLRLEITPLPASGGMM
jgi:hypothetical protein